MIEGIGHVFDLLSGLADLVGGVLKFFSPKKERKPVRTRAIPSRHPHLPVKVIK